jgi:hypothetical protein
MKSRVVRLRGLMIVLSVALLAAFAGKAFAGGDDQIQAGASGYSASGQIAGEQFAPHSMRARRHGKLHVRSGKIVDHDSTLGDGNFNFAAGHAECKRGERLVSGGIRRVASDGLIPGLRWAVQESGPVPSKRQWTVLAASDLGGLGRKDFIVIAVCE